jgi:hypothetical protein
MPDAPSLSAGYCDAGYEIGVANGEYVVNKAANAGQWTAAQLEVIDYAKEYDNLTIELTTENVNSLCIQVIVGGITATTGEPYTMYIVLYQEAVTDAKHTININLNNGYELYCYTSINQNILNNYIDDVGFSIESYKFFKIDYDELYFIKFLDNKRIIKKII